jgi:hypothetical protein
MNFQEDINHLEAYLVERHDVHVSFSYNEPNGSSKDSKIITINSRQTKQNQLLTLLHEAGHSVLYDDGDYGTTFSGIIYQPFKRRFSRANAVSVLRNEVMAWEEGYRLAAMLGIEVDLMRWSKLRDKCLYNYMKWALGEL